MVLSLLSLASAVSISAPGQMSEDDLLYFRVHLDNADAFEITKVYVGNNLLASVYSDGVTSEHDRKVIDAFTIDSDVTSTAGLTLYIVYIGLNVGTHSFQAKAYQGGNMTEDSVTVEVFESLPADFKQTTESQLSNLENSASTLETQISQQASQISTQESQLSNLQQNISSTSTELDTIKEEVYTLDESVDSLDYTVQSLTQKVEEEEQALIEVQDSLSNKIDNPLTGFAVASEGGEGSPLLPLLGLAVVIVIVFLYLNRRRFFSGRTDTIYEAPEPQALDEEEMEASEEKEIEEAVEDRKQGKWAFKGGDDDAYDELKRKEQEQEKKFSFRDLLKRKG